MKKVRLEEKKIKLKEVIILRRDWGQEIQVWKVKQWRKMKSEILKTFSKNLETFSANFETSPSYLACLHVALAQVREISKIARDSPFQEIETSFLWTETKLSLKFSRLFKVKSRRLQNSWTSWSEIKISPRKIEISPNAWQPSTKIFYNLSNGSFWFQRLF